MSWNQLKNQKKSPMNHRITIHPSDSAEWPATSSPGRASGLASIIVLARLSVWRSVAGVVLAVAVSASAEPKTLCRDLGYFPSANLTGFTYSHRSFPWHQLQSVDTHRAILRINHRDRLLNLRALKRISVRLAVSFSSSPPFFLSFPGGMRVARESPWMWIFAKNRYRRFVNGNCLIGFAAPACHLNNSRRRCGDGLLEMMWRKLISVVINESN